MPNIGFIGLGNMGAPMAANLVKSGDHVLGFDVVVAARQDCARLGVEIASSAKASVEAADIVITMLPAGEHVRAVWAEILPAAKRGALFID
ncbi:MAG: NAD(P)-binding domain-containing protein, partial [Xanthobacteraceae bacterium]